MTGRRILILSPIDPAAEARLRARHDVVVAHDASAEALPSLIADREVAILRSGVELDAAALSAAPELALVIRAGSGMDNIDLEVLHARGIGLARIPRPAAQAVGELTLALMLALARHVVTADRLTRAGRWAKHELRGSLIEGKVLGIIGAGNIGGRVGELGAALNMTPIGCVKYLTPELRADLVARGIRPAPFDEVIESADFLTIHVPLDESTHHLIDDAVLARVKPGAYLLNMARGGVVDEQALYRALTEGDRLRGAALDVHVHEGEGQISPLAELPNVILTPHIGSMASDTQRQIGERILEIMDELAAGERFPLDPALLALHPDLGEEA